jgi:hypothetical protein
MSAALLFALSAGAQNSYVYRRAITIDHTKAPNNDQANFPLLFNTTDPTLKSVANGGHVNNANGYDIIFADSTGTKLDHEIESYRLHWPVHRLGADPLPFAHRQHRDLPVLRQLLYHNKPGE